MWRKQTVKFIVEPATVFPFLQIVRPADLDLLTLPRGPTAAHSTIIAALPSTYAR